MLLAWLLGASLLTSGCGRVGLELLPRDAGEDGARPELDAGSDAGDDLDGAVQDGASDADTFPLVDGCALSEAGTCRTCNDDIGFDASTCGVGYCRSASACVEGVEIACAPGSPRASTDTTCDGVDDNCNGRADEDYVGTASSCGNGVCARAGTLMCSGGSVADVCMAGPPTSTLDDATGSGNGLDDNCDGRIDEDVSPCTDKTPRAFAAGVHMIPVPMGCTSATIQLWGGAGSAGREAGINPSQKARGGRGGSGGYARATLALTGPLTLYVGEGGGMNSLLGCITFGENQGAAAYNGGRGGSSIPSGPSAGAAGADGMVANGGAGATKNFGGASGGRGYFGGGGGGESAGDPVSGPPAVGGGGGAASVALLNGMRVMVAGGGGGGGGAAAVVWNFGEQGGNGGEGCSGTGTAGESVRTGGGGGGGVCVGMTPGMTTTLMGTNGIPANSSLLPLSVARGSSEDCAAGGNGYAIVTFGR